MAKSAASAEISSSELIPLGMKQLGDGLPGNGVELRGACLWKVHGSSGSLWN